MYQTLFIYYLKTAGENLKRNTGGGAIFIQIG